MGLMKKLTSAIVAASLVFGLVGTAFADWSAAGVATAAARMKSLGIVKGTVLPDGTIDLALNSNITRAELVTIVVRAFGQGDNAALLKGAAAYTDTASHWASGEIAIAKNIIEKNGYKMGITDTTFQPAGNVTAAQAIAFVMKFLGIAPAAGQAWPMDFIQGALDAGIISADDKAALAAFPNSPANRGLVFYLADKAFYGYKFATGQTMYTKYVDTTAPVVSVDSYTASTDVDSVTLTGKVSGQTALYVGGATNAITPDVDGNWKATVALAMGENKVFVQAVDLAGNAGVPASQVVITRVTGAAAAVKATLAATTIAAGATSALTVAVSDKAGNEIKNATYTVTADAAIGTFDTATMTLTAATTPATGNLTITSGDAVATVAVTVTAGALNSVSVDKNNVAPGTMVTLTAKDANGNVISSGVTYSQTSADAILDAAAGKFLASKAGNYSVTATVGDVTKTVVVGVYDTTLAKYKVTAAADNVIANNASTVDLTISATDANGNVITSNTDAVTVTSSALEYNITGSTFVTLAPGVSFTLKNGTKTITARTLSGQLGGVKANVTAGPAGSTQGSTGITLVDQVATSLSVSNSDTFLPSNSAANATTFTVKVLDQAGKDMKTGTYSIATSLSASNSSASIASGDTSTTKTVTYSNGSAPTVVVNPVQYASGTATLTATATGLGSGNKAVTVQMPGVATQFQVSADSNNKATATANSVDALKYTVKVVDAAGVPVTGTNPTTIKVTFPDLTSTNWGQISFDNGSTGTFVALADKTTAALSFTNGVASFSVKAVKYTGALNFQVKDTASAALAGPAATSVSFAGDVPVALGFSVNGVANKSAVTVGSNATTLSIVGQMYDAAGNKTTGTDGKIELAGAGANGGVDADVKINGKTNDEKVVVDANGSATFDVTVSNYVGATYTMTATGSYTNSGGTTATFTTAASGQVRQTVATVANTMAANVSLAMFDSAGRTQPISTVNANTPVYVTATVTDATGRKLPGETLAFAIPDGDTTSKFASTTPTITDVGDGTYTFSITPQSAPSAVFQVSTTKAATPAKAALTVGVRPGSSPTGLKIARTDTALSLTNGTVTAFTVNMVDTWGNIVVNNLGADKAIDVAISGITSGKLVQVRKTADGLAVSSQASGATTAAASLSIAQGNTGTTFYMVTDQGANTSFTISVTDPAVGGLTADASVTVNVK